MGAVSFMVYDFFFQNVTIFRRSSAILLKRNLSIACFQSHGNLNVLDIICWLLICLDLDKHNNFLHKMNPNL